MRLTAKERSLHRWAKNKALCEEAAPEQVADIYASFIVAEVAAGAYGPLGPSHSEEWPHWCGWNLGECLFCGSLWVLRGETSWDCQDCGIAYPIESSGTSKEAV